MRHNLSSSLLILSAFLYFFHETAVAFSPSVTQYQHGYHVSDLRHTTTAPEHRYHHRRSSILSHRMAASTLYYRDRHESEEVMTETISRNGPLPTSSYDNRQQQQQRQVSTKATTEKRSAVNTGGVSMPLINAIWFNQALIFTVATAIVTGVCLLSGQIDGASSAMGLSSLHWTFNNHFHSLFDWTLTPTRLLEGIVAAMPMIGLGTLVEHSDNRDASHVNFSTTNMVIGLFGRRKQSHTTDDPTSTDTSQVMALTAAIALATGISEEIVFRGYIPTAIAGLTHSVPLAFIGQAMIFALGHISPRSSVGENKVVGSLQFVNSLWYGFVYLMAGGDILPCIIAHVLYDMHVFCATWMTINRQMDYTEVAFRQQLVDTEEQAIQQIQKQAGHTLNTETLNFARRFFYAFDYEHKGSLSLSDVQRAVSYAFLQDKQVPSSNNVQEMFDKILSSRQLSYETYLPPDRLGVSEFLRVLFALKSQAWAK